MAAASSVYHYHVSDENTYPFTWTLGCYGSPTKTSTTAKCKALYTGCGTSAATETVFTALYPAGLKVSLWCPCYDWPTIAGCVTQSTTRAKFAVIGGVTIGTAVSKTTSRTLVLKLDTLV